ncbi:MAG: ABC transporter permease [Clostridiaceae bacterium]
MRVFKYFLKLALRQKIVILIYLGIFIFITILNTSSIQPSQTGFAGVRPTIKIIQEDHSPLADNLTTYLRSQGEEVAQDIKEADAKEVLFSGTVDSLIIIPPTFTVDFNQGRQALRVYTDDRQMEAILFNNTIQKYLMFLKADGATYGTIDPTRVTKALETQAVVTVNNLTVATGQESVTNWYRYYFNFISYVMLSLFIMIFGIVMSEFNDDGVKLRNSLIPFSSTKFQLNLVVAQLVVAFAITTLFLVIGFLIKGQAAPNLDWAGHSLNAFVFTLSALTLSFLINSITRKTIVHTSLATVLSLGTAFISGVMVPAELLDPSVVILSKFFPTYYFVQATSRIIDQSGYLGFLGVQLLFALLFLVLGLTITRLKQGEELLPLPLSKNIQTSYT